MLKVPYSARWLSDKDTFSTSSSIHATPPLKPNAEPWQRMPIQDGAYCPTCRVVITQSNRSNRPQEMPPGLPVRGSHPGELITGCWAGVARGAAASTATLAASRHMMPARRTPATSVFRRHARLHASSSRAVKDLLHPSTKAAASCRFHSSSLLSLVDGLNVATWERDDRLVSIEIDEARWPVV